jgi:hypothetical protein
VQHSLVAEAIVADLMGGDMFIYNPGRLGV